MLSLGPVPQIAPITNEKFRLLQTWLDWFLLLRSILINASVQIASSAFAAIGAALAFTSVGAPLDHTGRYRVGWYLRLTQAATTSSSATVTIRWTDGGIVRTIAGTALVANTLDSNQSNSYLLTADVSTNIEASVAYASVGGTSMQYALDVVIEAVP